jgi:hypothetical protein
VDLRHGQVLDRSAPILDKVGERLVKGTTHRPAKRRHSRVTPHRTQYGRPAKQTPRQDGDDRTYQCRSRAALRHFWLQHDDSSTGEQARIIAERRAGAMVMGEGASD